MSHLRWKNTKIGLKYNIALLITILLVIIASTFVTMSLYKIRNTISEIKTTSTRAVELTQMNAMFKSKELIILDYISLPRERLVNEYRALQDDFTALQEKLKSDMHIDDKFNMFDIIEKNNQKVDDTFNNEIISKSSEEAVMAVVKVSSLREPTALTFERLKAEVDKEMEQVINSAGQEVQNAIFILIVSVISALVP